MKRGLIFLVLAFYFQINQSIAACPLEEVYTQHGWVLHDSKEFNLYLPLIQSGIKSSLADGSIQKDLKGSIVTNQTLDRTELLMSIQSWDSKLTSKSEMYGDYAIFQAAYNRKEYLEVRWYQNGKKHIIFNDNILGCISIIPPVVDNTIF